MSDELMQEDTEAPSEAEQEVQPEQPRRFKVKVDDAEEEVDEQELLRGYQKAKSSDKRFQEASRLRQEAAQIHDLVKQLKDNPDLLEQLGIDVDSYSEKRMLRNLERSLKSPEELELEEYRSEKQKREAKRQEEAQAFELDQVSNEIDTEIFNVLSSNDMKPTPRLIARIAEQMLASMTESGSRLSAKDAFQNVKSHYSQDVSELLHSLSPEQLAQAFPELVSRLRNHSIKQSQAPSTPSFKAGSTPKQETEVKVKRKSIDEWLK